MTSSNHSSNSTALFIGLYYVTSIAMNIFNFVLYNKQRLSFPHPLLLTSFTFFFQFLVTLIYLTATSRVGAAWQAFSKQRGIILACAIFSSLDIGLSNVSLSMIPLSVYVMVKSAAPIFILIGSFVTGVEKPSWKLFGIIAMVATGVLLSVYKPNTSKDGEYNVVGMALIVAATGTAGLRWCMTQLIVSWDGWKVNDGERVSGPFMTVLVLSPFISVFLFIASLLIEFIHSDWMTANNALMTSTIFIIASCLTFVLILVEYRVVHDASAMTLSIASIVKELAIIAVSVVIMDERMSWSNYIGLLVSMFGVVLYNQHRMKTRDMVHFEGDDVTVKEVEESLMVVVPVDELLATLSIPVSRRGHSPLPRSTSVTDIETQSPMSIKPNVELNELGYKASPVKARHNRRSSFG